MSTQHTLHPSTARVRLHVRARACAVGKANLANDMLADTELQKLIGEDKAFERILDQLKTLQVQHELRHKKAKLRWLPILHPDGKFRSTWDLLLALVLVFTCFVVPLRLAWPAWFGDAGLWLALDVTFDVYFISDLCLNFITGYYKDSIVIMEAFPVHVSRSSIPRIPSGRSASKQSRVRDPSDDDGDTGGADTGADTGGVDCESDTVDEGAGAGEQAESRYISGQEFTPRRSLRSKSIMPPKEVASDFSFLPAMIGSENLAMEHRASLRFTSMEETNMNASDDPRKVVENFVRRGSAAVSSAVGRKQSLTVEGGTPAAAGTRRRSGASDQVAPYTSGPDAPAP